MRKNVQAVFQAWQGGKACKACDAVWTDGKHVFSYRTCIAALDESTGHVVMNMTWYSMTTSTHQGALRSLLGSVVTREVHDVPQGAGPERVLHAPALKPRAAA